MSTTNNTRKKCMNTYCKKMNNENKKMMEKILQEVKEHNKTLKNKLKTQQENLTVEEKEKIKNEIKRNNKMLHKYKNQSKTKKKQIENINIKSCAKHFCNPGCKDTLFDPNGLSEKFTKGMDKNLREFHEENRKEIFGKKTTVLTEDHFYEKISKKHRTKMKKNGAISGCVIALI